MPVPNSISRTLHLSHDQDTVWSALTTIDGLTGWFGSHAEGVVAPGQDIRMRWEGYDAEATLSVQVVDPQSVFSLCWGINGAPEDDPRRTYVEFVLTPTAAGTTLTVTESGFAQPPDEWLETSYEGNVEGWRSELDELVAYLDAA